jgi:hypothetical protein
MDTREIAPGLWRWTAAHPSWTQANDRPDGWGRFVGSIYYEPEPPGDALVLIDPLAPAADTDDAARFWAALERDVSRAALPVAILVSNRFHGRSAREIYQRFSGSVGATVHVPVGAEGRVACDPTHVFKPGDSLPGGVAPHFLDLDGPDEPEVAFHLAPHRALVFADAVLGAGGGEVRVAPPSWSGDGAARERYAAHFRPSVERLLALDPAMLLTSHGEPVLDRGRERLAAALRGPAWGET